jgi:hypothetical protein
VVSTNGEGAGAEPGGDSTPHLRRRRSLSARASVLVALAVLLVAGGIVDRRPARRAVASVPSDLLPPVAAPPGALSSSWYCAGATGQPGSAAAGSLVIANATDHPLHGTAFLLAAGTGSPTPPTPVAVDVGPLNRVALDEAVLNSPYVGALVDLDGGGAVVEQQVQGPQGISASPCARAGSQSWYFADGTTIRGATLLTAVLNPFPEDAIVDLSFVTEQGREAPSEYQGIVVGPRQLAVLDIGAHLPLRRQVATSVSVRTGRVAAFQTLIATTPPPVAAGQPPPIPLVPGLTAMLGAPAPATTLWWPDGLAADGVTETYRIFNPGPVAAHVRLDVALDTGSADPFDVTVAPGDTTAIVANAESRIPKAVAHAAVLHSLNGVGVVVQRSVAAGPPSPRAGRAALTGSGRVARRWLLAAGAAAPTLDEWVVVYNPGPHPTRVSILGLNAGGTLALDGLQSLSVEPGRRLAVRLNDHAPQLSQAVLVESGSDIVVERDLYGVGTPGLSAVIGVPLG